MISNMKIERIKKELTQEALGRLTGIPQYRVSLIERGIEPKEWERQMLTEALNLPIDGMPFDEFHSDLSFRA